MQIFRSAVVIADIDVDDKSVLKQRLMELDVVELNFTLDIPITFEIDDYVIYDSIEYYLFKKPSIKKNRADEYVYSLTFSGRMHKLERVVFRSNNETSFYLTGSLADFMTAIRDEGQRVFGASPAFDRQIINGSPGIKNLFFDNLNLLEALQYVCDEFDVEFEFRNGTGQNLIIDIRTQINVTNVLSLRFKEGLRSIDCKETNNENLVTRLFSFGGERNIEATYGQKRLRLPFPGTNPLSVQEWNVATYGVKEGVFFFDDIYPRRTGSISNISTDGTTWKFRDSSMDFDLNAQLIAETARITFNTGPLSGNEFEIVSYDNALKEFEIATFTDDQDLTLPNGTTAPTTGNEYVLHNIKMPSSYITNAENELAVSSLAKVKELASPILEINCVADPVYLRKNSIEILIGQRSLFNEVDLGISNEVQRVVYMTKSIANEHIYTLKFSNIKLKPRLSRLNASIRENKSNIEAELKSFRQYKFFNRGN